MTASPFALDGKRVLITGGTRGIGRAISTQFARAGASVIANYVRDDESAQSLCRELANEHSRVELCRADLTAPDATERILDAIGDEPLSALVHCAATGIHRPLSELTLRHWDFTFALNVRAFFQLVDALSPRLVSGSSIVALSSHGAVRAVPNYAIVGASKGALEALCRHMAVELAPRGVRVNILAAGSVPTQAWDAFSDKEARVRQAIERAPAGRLTTVDEVARAAQFLCSDASAGVNGHTLIVDGGESVRA